MMGLEVMGEKRTQDTHSEWPSGSPMVYLHSPRVFHSLMVLSREPDTICGAWSTVNAWSAQHGQTQGHRSKLGTRMGGQSMLVGWPCGCTVHMSPASSPRSWLSMLTLSCAHSACSCMHAGTAPCTPRPIVAVQLDPSAFLIASLPPSHLAVVHGEGDGQHILGVAHEAAGGAAGVQVPQAQGAVPRASQAELAIGGDDDVLHEVGVALQGALGSAVVVPTALQLPNNDGLVTAKQQAGRLSPCSDMDYVLPCCMRLDHSRRTMLCLHRKTRLHNPLIIRSPRSGQQGVAAGVDRARQGGHPPANQEQRITC